MDCGEMAISAAFQAQPKRILVIKDRNAVWFRGHQFSTHPAKVHHRIIPNVIHHVVHLHLDSFDLSLPFSTPVARSSWSRKAQL